MSNDVLIGPGKRVTLHFALLLEDGREIDSTRRGRPATFVVGDGSLLPGFEQALFGLGNGADEQFRLGPEQAFGPPNPDNVHKFPRRRFALTQALAPGLAITFQDPGEGELVGVVESADEQEVVVDFNHPLAGRTLIFDVSVLKVEEYLIS